MQLKIHGPAVGIIRHRTGHRQSDFADLCDISQAYLNNIEAGRKQPSPAVLRRIANELGVTLREITYAAPTPGDEDLEVAEDA